MINRNKKFCYRITHIENLPILLETGLVCKGHPNADANYINIGNTEIIDVRSNTPVRIDGYGMIGDYVPFYFTSKSIMLYNIHTGYWHPKVPKRKSSEIMVMRFNIADLCELDHWFYTDGQANDRATTHYNSLDNIDCIDWNSIQNSNFSKGDDIDRARRYQAEFLVRNEVPIDKIESLNVYDEQSQQYVKDILKQFGMGIEINMNKKYYF